MHEYVGYVPANLEALNKPKTCSNGEVVVPAFGTKGYRLATQSDVDQQLESMALLERDLFDVRPTRTFRDLAVLTLRIFFLSMSMHSGDC